MMKLEYDPDVDAAYVSFELIKSGDAEKQVELNENIILDYDNKGKLIGIEILHASKVLNKRILQTQTN